MFSNSEMMVLILSHMAAQGNDPMHLLDELYEETQKHLVLPARIRLTSAPQAIYTRLGKLWTSLTQARKTQPAPYISMLRPGLKQTNFELSADLSADRANPSVSQALAEHADKSESPADSQEQLSLDLERGTDPATIIAAVLARYQEAEWIDYAPRVAEDDADFIADKLGTCGPRIS